MSKITLHLNIGPHRMSAFGVDSSRPMPSGDFMAAYTYESDDTPEAVFERFNINHPADYRNRSLCAGDIVEIDGKFFFCDSCGWKRVEMYDQPTATTAFMEFFDGDDHEAYIAMRNMEGDIYKTGQIGVIGTKMLTGDKLSEGAGLALFSWINNTRIKAKEWRAKKAAENA